MPEKLTRVLIVGSFEDPGLLRRLNSGLEFQIDQAGSMEEARGILQNMVPDMVPDIMMVSVQLLPTRQDVIEVDAESVAKEAKYESWIQQAEHKDQTTYRLQTGDPAISPDQLTLEEAALCRLQLEIDDLYCGVIDRFNLRGGFELIKSCEGAWKTKGKLPKIVFITSAETPEEDEEARRLGGSLIVNFSEHLKPLVLVSLLGIAKQPIRSLMELWQ